MLLRTDRKRRDEIMPTHEARTSLRELIAELEKFKHDVEKTAKGNRESYEPDLLNLKPQQLEFLEDKHGTDRQEEALYEDIEAIYGTNFDILQTIKGRYFEFISGRIDKTYMTLKSMKLNEKEGDQ